MKLNKKAQNTRPLRLPLPKRHLSMKISLLSSSDRFLMSEYLTLSGPGAVSLLSSESASVNSSSVVRLSFKPASVSFCPALSRLHSFHPVYFDCSAGRSIACLQYWFWYRDLWGWGCWCLQRSPQSVSRFARSEWVWCLCWECHRSFYTACLLLHWPLSGTLLSFLPCALW